MRRRRRPGGADRGLPAAGGGGILRYAVPALPGDLDPLAADSRIERLVSRQVYEPLVGSSRAPYSGDLSREDLAASITPSSTRAEWTIVLRPGVRFQDGTPLDVAALLANARRWIASPAGAGSCPARSAPTAPGRGRCACSSHRSPTPGAAPSSASCAAPELRPSSRPALRGPGPGRSRQGPRTAGSLALARNAAWWGSAAGLGPALDAVSFVEAPIAGETGGAARERERPGRRGPRRARGRGGRGGSAAAVAGGRGGVAYLASVRGLEAPPALPRLSAVWLTNIGE